MTVGFVLVSHSPRLAEGARELAEQVSQGVVPIVAVGGAEDGSLGTNAMDIAAAIESLFASNDVDGVLVFMDLGSAVMSAEVALEQVDETVRDRVRMADAPFVEGAIAAVVEASLDSGVEAALAVAEAARHQVKMG
jgi:phosphoenolpyruvate---glycerone phosphotransferase subunit DhaM